MGQAASSAAAAQREEDAASSAQPSALVIVGPSGVGKGTLINKLKEGSDKFGFSCSHTTRKPREGEENGVHYHFTDRDTFEREIAEGKFLEYAYVHSNIYGTSVKAVQDVAAAGKCCILDIDVQGARQVRAAGLPAIFVFICPPSLEELERRLRGRGTEAEEQITTRLRNAREELASLEEPGLYDYAIVNNDLESCLKELAVVAARALAGGIGPAAPAAPEDALSPSAREPMSATASLRGWLGDTGSPGMLDSGVMHSGGMLSFLGLARWRGRVALVTGASGVVGWDVALALACAGVRVVAVARQRERLEALQDAVAAAGVSLSEFLPVACDLTKEAEVTALPRIVSQRWAGAGIDVLVNAVGAGRRAGKEGSILSGSSSAWVEAVSAGVLGTALVTREAVQDMIRRGETGHVVNVTCASGAAGESSRGMHGVATAAAHALGEELRAEVAEIAAPVRVSCVATGPIAVPGAAVAADDVVAAVLFCLSAPPHVDISDLVVRPAQAATGVGLPAPAAATS